MAFSPSFAAIISAEQRGIIEVWSPSTGKALVAGSAPTSSSEVVSLHGAPQAQRSVSFRYKMDTDLFALARSGAAPTSLAISPNGRAFAVASLDSKIRLFDLASGKLKRTFDESVEATEALRGAAIRRSEERAKAEAEGATAFSAFEASEEKRKAARGGGVDMAALAGGVEAMDFGLRVAVEKELLVRAKASHAGKGGGGGG